MRRYSRALLQRGQVLNEQKLSFFDFSDLYNARSLFNLHYSTEDFPLQCLSGTKKDAPRTSDNHFSYWLRSFSKAFFSMRET